MRAEHLRAIMRSFFFNLGFVRRPALRYCIENDLFPNIFVEMPSKKIRAFLSLPEYEHETQLNQDIFALIRNHFRQGYFVEIGANDGYTLSNTSYLEDCFNWSGLLVEANPRYLESLRRRQRSKLAIKAVSSVSGTTEFLDAGLYGGIVESIDGSNKERRLGVGRITVECETLDRLLDSAKAPDHIDFISIDVEGGELDIMEQLTASRYRFRCGTVEFNSRQSDYLNMRAILERAGYSVLWPGNTMHDLFFADCRS